MPLDRLIPIIASAALAPASAGGFDEGGGEIGGLGFAQHRRDVAVRRRCSTPCSKLAALLNPTAAKPSASKRPVKRLERNRASALSPSSGSARRTWLSEVEAAGASARSASGSGRTSQMAMPQPVSATKVEDRRPRAPLGAEAAGGGAHPDQRVVFLVLDRVERVVADHPEHASDPQPPGGGFETAGDARPADQRAPAEDEAEPRLRPPGDPLHEGVGGDQGDAGERGDDARPGAAGVSTSRPTRQSERDQHPRGARADPAAGQRAEAGAGDLPVEVAVDEVVIDAARRAHREGAEQEPGEQAPAAVDPASSMPQAQGQ